MEILTRLEPAWVPIQHADETLEFYLHPVTAAQRVTTFSLMRDDIGEAYMYMVRSAVKGWRGITRGGEPVEFSPAELEALFSVEDNGPLLLLLGGAIADRARLSETERKNS